MPRNPFGGTTARIITAINDKITPDTLEYLAGQFDSNVRDLEGALNDISLMAKVKKLKEITIDVAAEAIRARKNDSSQMLVIPIEKIQEAGIVVNRRIPIEVAHSSEADFYMETKKNKMGHILKLEA